MKRVLTVVMSLLVGTGLMLVLAIALANVGPGPCYCDPGASCRWSDYLHRQSTVYLCGGEVRYGRWP
jgi:hypothetical protein